MHSASICRLDRLGGAFSIPIYAALFNLLRDHGVYIFFVHSCFVMAARLFLISLLRPLFFHTPLFFTLLGIPVLRPFFLGTFFDAVLLIAVLALVFSTGFLAILTIAMPVPTILCIPARFALGLPTVRTIPIVAHFVEAPFEAGANLTIAQ